MSQICGGGSFSRKVAVYKPLLPGVVSSLTCSSSLTQTFPSFERHIVIRMSPLITLLEVGSLSAHTVPREKSQRSPVSLGIQLPDQMVLRVFGLEAAGCN